MIDVTMDSNKTKDNPSIEMDEKTTNPSASDCAGEEREEQDAQKKNKKKKASEIETGGSLIKLIQKDQKIRLEIGKCSVFHHSKCL